MARKPFNPLACLPSSKIVEQSLAEAEARAAKLRALLHVVREVENAGDVTLSQEDGPPEAMKR
jgi:hypothetical protein